jgi:hypothetical protein
VHGGAPDVSAGLAMTPRRPGSSTSSLERSIEHALVPGSFISYGVAFSFIRGLEEVESEIARLVATEPGEAVALYETFLAGCYEKSEEIDDSSGGLGEFVGELYCGWVRARQAACADSVDTAARLAKRMEDDPHGYCYGLEKKVATALDAPGLDAFAAELRRRFDAAAVPAPFSDGPHLRSEPGRSRRRWGDALRALYLHKGDVVVYVALAEQMEVTAEDCDAIAGMLVAQAKAAEALSWVDRGLVLAEQSRGSATVGADLAKLRRETLAALGRGDESLSDAWTAFTHRPSTFTYGELMRYVPEGDRGAWHERAIAAASSAELHSHLQLLLETGENGEARRARADHLGGGSRSGEPLRDRARGYAPGAGVSGCRGAALGCPGVSPRERQEEQVLRRGAQELRAREAVLPEGRPDGGVAADRRGRARPPPAQDRLHDGFRGPCGWRGAGQ